MSKNPKSDYSYQAFREALEPLLRQTYEAGFTAGYITGHDEGRAQGYFEGIAACTPAISDGLRHGSPACGRIMQALPAMRGDEDELED